MDRLVEVLTKARDLGFLGPGPVDAHIEHAEGFAVALGEEPDIAADLGSGGGVPGLVLARRWPAARLVLMDANERRTAFLVEVVEGLGLGDRVTVVRERAEVVGRDVLHRGRYDAVVARGFGPPPVVAECAAALLRVGGKLVVSEPPEGQARWDTEGLTKLGLRLGPSVRLAAGYQVLEQAEPCPKAYPRRVGIPGKRPLW